MAAARSAICFGVGQFCSSRSSQARSLHVGPQNFCRRFAGSPQTAQGRLACPQSFSSPRASNRSRSAAARASWAASCGLPRGGKFDLRPRRSITPWFLANCLQKCEHRKALYLRLMNGIPQTSQNLSTTSGGAPVSRLRCSVCQSTAHWRQQNFVRPVRTMTPHCSQHLRTGAPQSPPVSSSEQNARLSACR
jgi:hypothetical protein